MIQIRIGGIWLQNKGKQIEIIHPSQHSETATGGKTTSILGGRLHLISKPQQSLSCSILGNEHLSSAGQLEGKESHKSSFFSSLSVYIGTRSS